MIFYLTYSRETYSQDQILKDIEMPAKTKVAVGIVSEVEAQKLLPKFYAAVVSPDVSAVMEYWDAADKVKRGQAVLVADKDHSTGKITWKVCTVTSVKENTMTGENDVRVQDGKFSWRVSGLQDFYPI